MILTSKKSTIIIFLIILLFPSFINAVDNYCASTDGVLVFNTTAWDDTNLTNVSLYGTWGGGWHLNETNHSGINNTDYIFTKNFTGFADGTYYYKLRAVDWCKNWRDSSIKSFRIDTTPPITNLISPTNTSTHSSSNTIIFTYNVSELVATYCNLIINNVTVQTDTSIATYTTQTFTQTLSNGDYDWSITCVDVCYLENTSETRSLTVSYTAPIDDGSSSGVGGGGGTSGTSEITFTGPIKAWLSKTILFARDLGVISIDIITKYDVSDTITVQDITTTPNVPSLPISLEEGAVYKYLFISAPRINTVLEKAVIKFKVAKEWFAENNFGEKKVELRRLKDTLWETLPTKKTNLDSNYFYYSAETTSFSKFAIVVKKEVAVEEEIKIYIYPYSLFYSLKLWVEDIKLFFLPSKVWKAEYCLKLADKRSKELQKIVKENKLKYINQLESERSKMVNKAYSYSNKMESLADQKYILKKIEDRTIKHLVVLESIKSGTYQKKERINSAILGAKQVKENVLKKIKEVDEKMKYIAEVVGNRKYKS